MSSQLILWSVLMAAVIVTATNAQVHDARRRFGEDPLPNQDQPLPDDQAVPCARLHIDLAPSHIPRSLRDLYDLSDVIVEGVVAMIFPSRELGSARSLETDALIGVTTVLRGSDTIRQVLISQTGGRRGRYCIEPAEYALVRRGEKYILFLREDNRPNLPVPARLQRYIVTGLSSGLFYFENDRMQVRVHRDWLRAQYEGQTLDQIKSELQELSGFLVVP